MSDNKTDIKKAWIITAGIVVGCASAGHFLGKGVERGAQTIATQVDLSAKDIQTQLDSLVKASAPDSIQRAKMDYIVDKLYDGGVASEEIINQLKAIADDPKFTQKVEDSIMEILREAKAFDGALEGMREPQVYPYNDWSPSYPLDSAYLKELEEILNNMGPASPSFERPDMPLRFDSLYNDSDTIKRKEPLQYNLVYVM